MANVASRPVAACMIKRAALGGELPQDAGRGEWQGAAGASGRHRSPRRHLVTRSNAGPSPAPQGEATSRRLSEISRSLSVCS